MMTEEKKVIRKTRFSRSNKAGARKRQTFHMTQGKANMKPVISDILKLVITVSMGEVAIKSTCKCCLVRGWAMTAQIFSQKKYATPEAAATPIMMRIRRERSS